MECGSEEKPPLPAPTPSVWTDLQRAAWLQTAVSQQRMWLLEKLNQSNDRATHVIEESCKAMEARLLHAAVCADKPMDTSNYVAHHVTDETPEPGSTPRPDQPLDILPSALQLRRSNTHRPAQVQNNSQVAGSIEAWAIGMDDIDGADDAEHNIRSITKNTLFTGAFKRSNSFMRFQQQNQIRQLIGSHRNVTGLDPKSVRGRMDRFFQGRFDAFVGFLIIANTIIMFVQLQYYGELANSSLGLSYTDWAHAKPVFEVFEVFFSAIFLLEFLLRVYVYRCAYFQEGFNILDSIVVPLTALNTFVVSNVEESSTNVSFIRLLRMIRVVRAFRVVRTMGKFKELRLLMRTIVASVFALFWSMLIMFIFQLMTAILLCQTLHDFIVDPAEDLEMRQWVNQYYGNGLKALYTVFELTFSGCWPNYARPVIERVHPFYVIVFVTYVTAVVFAMTRIVSAMFLKETLQQASHVAEMMVKEKANDTKTIIGNLRALFMAADTNQDGELTQDELTGVLGFEKVKLWLAKLGVDASDPEALFHLLDVDGNGTISSETFVTCVKQLKGEARAQDLIPVVHNCKQILSHCKALREDHNKLASLLKHKAQDLCIAET